MIRSRMQWLMVHLVSFMIIAQSYCNEILGAWTGPAIALGALYDPNLLPDHRGRYFQHKAAKLVQLDMVDIDDNLIAPWDMADKLREGTVVLVEATLVCWHIAGKGNGDRDKKVYYGGIETSF
jgi:hypothetical protein